MIEKSSPKTLQIQKSHDLRVEKPKLLAKDKFHLSEIKRWDAL